MQSEFSQLHAFHRPNWARIFDWHRARHECRLATGAAASSTKIARITDEPNLRFDPFFAHDVLAGFLHHPAADGLLHSV